MSLAPRAPAGLTLRAMVPNAITATALCFGLSGVRFAIDQKWELAIALIVLAGVLDGFDGRIARLLKANSKFGAELDSLSDNIAFGTAPALILFLWSLQYAPRFGWTVALALAVCCALRLARFNSRIDSIEQPHKAAGYNTGVPAPAGAGLAFVPIYLWLVLQGTGYEGWFRDWRLVMPWTGFIALLMISSVPTFSWASMRIRQSLRLLVLAFVAVLAAALVSEPWWTLLAISALYLSIIPVGMASYARVMRRRASEARPEAAAGSAPPAG